MRTDHSIEAAIGLSGKLENLSRLWQEIFLPFYASEADVVALFEGRAKRAPAPTARRKVDYFRDRADYLDSLKLYSPNRHVGRHVRSGNSKTAYFYADPKKNNDRTLYHEATHQLFNESRKVVAAPRRKRKLLGRRGDRHADGVAAPGGKLLGGRRLSGRSACAPPRSGCCATSSTSRWTSSPVTPCSGSRATRASARFYSQAAGLTHFLVFYDHGRYRDALMAFLLALYTGKDDHETLARLTGENYKTLDSQYREFIVKSLPQQAAATK